MRLQVQAPGYRWTAESSSVSETSWRQILPLTMRAVQSEWSGDVMELFTGSRLTIGDNVEPVPFQYPGLLVYEPNLGQFAICFGEGRWQDGFGPLNAIPVAHIAAGLDQLQEFGRSLQFVGAQQLTISIAEQTTETPAEISEEQSIEIALGDAVARGVLLEDTSPYGGALGNLLPLHGKGTNTYASGPLTRFWNDAGGPEGATLLEVDEQATVPSDHNRARLPWQDYRRSLATPGYVYYMTSPPWNGLRIAARGATVMKSALPGGDRSRLVPVAKLTGDWSAFSNVAANLRFTGALPMTIRLIPNDPER